MTNKEPNICQKSPYKIKVEEGKRYSWCSCGYSKKDPFCDGSHKNYPELGLKSLKYEAKETKDLYFCGCKYTKTPPFCDGSHSSL